jgi:plastocyanin
MAMPPTGGAAGGDTVTIPGKYFAPSHLTVLTGTTVTWRNDDSTAHSVQADDHSFGSPSSLSTGASFSTEFDKPGTYTYYCTIHRQMRGTIEVAALGLTGPSDPVAPGDEAMLDVLAPAGSGPVTLERLTATGSEAVATAEPGADGTASFHVMVDGPSRFRARAGDLTSTVVPVAVAPRVTATVKRVGRRVTVKATVVPALPGATLQLQRYVRERFDYLPLRTVRSKAGAAVTFRFRSASRAALRVAVTKAPGGWSPATSRHAVVGREQAEHHQHM